MVILHTIILKKIVSILDQKKIYDDKSAKLSSQMKKDIGQAAEKVQSGATKIKESFVDKIKSTFSPDKSGQGRG